MRQFIMPGFEIAFCCALIGFILYAVIRPLLQPGRFNFLQWLHNNTAFFCGAWIVVCLWRELWRFTVTAYLMEILQFVLFSLSLLHIALTVYLYQAKKLNTGNLKDRGAVIKALKALLLALCFLPAAGLIAFSIIPEKSGKCAILYRWDTYQTTLESGLHFRTPLISSFVYADLAPHTTTISASEFSPLSRSADGKIINFKISFKWQLNPQRLSADYSKYFVKEDSGLIYDIALGIKYFAHQGVNAALRSMSF